MLQIRKTRHTLWVKRIRMPGDCMTFRETSGSGCRISTTPTITAIARLSIQPDRRSAHSFKVAQEFKAVRVGAVVQVVGDRDLPDVVEIRAAMRQPHSRPTHRPVHRRNNK